MYITTKGVNVMDIKILKPFPFILKLVNKALASCDALVVEDLLSDLEDLGGWGDEPEWSWDFEAAHSYAYDLVENHLSELIDWVE
jgi:hypothetical protein